MTKKFCSRVKIFTHGLKILPLQIFYSWVKNFTFADSGTSCLITHPDRLTQSRSTVMPPTSTVMPPTSTISEQEGHQFSRLLYYLIAIYSMFEVD